MSGLPLAGVRVLELGHYIAGPAATQVLLDLGAEVTKVEPPAGDQARTIGAYGEGIVCAYNRGKRSVALDLRDDEQREVALRLVDEADVLVQNLRAGALDRLGLGVDLLRARNPRLVVVSVTGFPTEGPSAQRAGLDIAAQAESGIMAVTGERDGDPQRVGFPVSDVGASYAVVQAVLAALLRRERTGEGGVAEVSLLNVSIHMQSALWGEWHTSGEEPHRKGNGQATVAPAADLIATTDGSVVLSAYTAEHFRRLCGYLGKPWMVDDPRFVDNPARVAHRDDLLAEIEAVLGRLTTAQCVDELSALGLVVAPVRSYADVRDSPDVRAAGLLTSGTDPQGRDFPVPFLPFALDGVQPRPGQVVPGVGEDALTPLSRAGEG